MPTLAKSARVGHPRAVTICSTDPAPSLDDVFQQEVGDRAVSVQRLAELADFYAVPVSELLPDSTPNGAAEPPPRLILDLEKLQRIPPDRSAPLARYTATIQSQRGDYNGRVLSIRQDDLRTLAVIYDESPSQLTEQLITWGVLNAEARRAIELPA